MDLTTAKTRALVDELRRRAKVPDGIHLEVSQDGLMWADVHYQGTGGTAGTLHIFDPDNLDPKPRLPQPGETLPPGEMTLEGFRAKPQPQTFAERVREIHRNFPARDMTAWDHYQEDIAEAVDGLLWRAKTADSVASAARNLLRPSSGPDLLEAAKLAHENIGNGPQTAPWGDIKVRLRDAIVAEEARRKT